MADFFIKRNDLAPAITGTATDEDGDIIDLSAAITVKFLMTNPGSGVVKVDAAGAITDAPNGRVSYQWAGTDTDEEGDYDGEFEVTWSDGTKTTFPNFRYLQIKIGRDIA